MLLMKTCQDRKAVNVSAIIRPALLATCDPVMDPSKHGKRGLDIRIKVFQMIFLIIE
jgi:hypothetical protein